MDDLIIYIFDKIINPNKKNTYFKGMFEFWIRYLLQCLTTNIILTNKYIFVNNIRSAKIYENLIFFRYKSHVKTYENV